MIDVVPAEQLAGTLSAYRCTYDDIESFLQIKAITYENRGWCSTYLLIDEDRLLRQGNLFVDGYFTLSNKVLRLYEDYGFLELQRDEKLIQYFKIL